MKALRVLVICIAASLYLALICPSLAPAQSLKEKNDALLKRLQRVHGLSDREIDSIRAIFRESGSIGQGNPAIAKHPVTEEK